MTIRARCDRLDVHAEVKTQGQKWVWWAVSRDSDRRCAYPYVDRMGTVSTEAAGWEKVREALDAVFGKEAA